MTNRTPPDPTDALPLTHIVYHVLLSLATQNRHGYGIIKDVEDCTEGEVELEAGTLYAAIKRLKDDGLIQDAPTLLGQDARRRTYALTKHGRRVLQAESLRLEALVGLARAADVLPQVRKVGA